MSSSHVTGSVTYPGHGSPWRRFRPQTALQWAVTWWPSLLCVAIIRTESTEHWSAANTRHRYYEWFKAHVYPANWETWGIINWEIRKAGHVMGFGLICMIFYYCWSRTLLPHVGEPVSALRRRRALGALLCSLLLASADELHQLFVPGRTAAVHDVVIDFAGGFAALTLWFGLEAWFRRSDA